MRDPAVLAVFAMRITAAEHAAILAGLPIVRPFWPPVSCRGSVVGLHVAGEVIGEALLTYGRHWHRRGHAAGRRVWQAPGVGGDGPERPRAPAIGRGTGTLTPARDWEDFT